MELRHLRYFIAVAEEENITRAAERLHLSQPPLSRQIRDLEEEIGVPLLERNAKSVRLTRAGHVFLAEARAVLWRVDQAVTAAQAAVRKAEFHLGYAPSPSGEFLSPVLQRFQQALPHLRLVLHDLTSAEMVAGLRAGRLQAALMVQSPGPVPRGLRFAPVHASPIGVILSRTHPLAQKTSLTPQAVAAESLAILNRGDYPDYQRLLRRALGRPPARLRVAQECDGALSLIAAVEASQTVAVLARSIVSVAGARVAFVPLRPAPPPLRVGVCHPDVSPLPPELQLFLETARTVVKNL